MECGVKVRECAFLKVQLNDTKVIKASSDPNRIASSMGLDEKILNKFMRDMHTGIENIANY